MKITNKLDDRLCSTWYDLAVGQGFVVEMGTEPQIKISPDKYFSFAKLTIFNKNQLPSYSLYPVDLELIVCRPGE
jgi:hypothetical protein